MGLGTADTLSIARREQLTNSVANGGFYPRDWLCYVISEEI